MLFPRREDHDLPSVPRTVSGSTDETAGGIPDVIPVLAVEPDREQSQPRSPEIWFEREMLTFSNGDIGPGLAVFDGSLQTSGPQ